MPGGRGALEPKPPIGGVCVMLERACLSAPAVLGHWWGAASRSLAQMWWQMWRSSSRGWQAPALPAAGE